MKKTTTIKLQNQATKKMVDVEAHLIGDYCAVHRDRLGRAKRWTVTHLPTGARCVPPMPGFSDSLNKAEAIKVAKRFDELFGDQLDCEDLKELSRALSDDKANMAAYREAIVMAVGTK